MFRACYLQQANGRLVICNEGTYMNNLLNDQPIFHPFSTGLSGVSKTTSFLSV
jgi:hypothetical protein